jgi:nitrate reductase NapD
MNISSAIIHAHPGDIAVVQAGLAALAGVEVHAVSPEGKLIVTIETDDDGSNVATYEEIGRLRGRDVGGHGLPPNRIRTRNGSFSRGRR